MLSQACMRHAPKADKIRAATLVTMSTEQEKGCGRKNPPQSGSSRRQITCHQVRCSWADWVKDATAALTTAAHGLPQLGLRASARSDWLQAHTVPSLVQQGVQPCGS